MSKTLLNVLSGANRGSNGDLSVNWFGRAVAMVACAVLFFGAGIAQAEAIEVEDFEGFIAAIAEYEDAEDDVVIEIGDDFELEGLVAIPANAEGLSLTIKSAGTTAFILTRDTLGNLFTVPAGATLILENIVIDGAKDEIEDGKGSLVLINGGTLIVTTGAVLENNNISDGNGSGVNFAADTNGVLIVGGNAKIADNTRNDSIANNVFLAAGRYITIGTVANGAGVPAAGMDIWVSKVADSGKIVEEDGTEANKAFFSADAKDKVIALNEDGDLLIADPPPPFVAVANITVAADTINWGTPFRLVGTVVPDSATNKTIVWSVVADSTTASGAAVSNDTLTVTGAGRVVVKATVTNGFTATTNYTKDFNIIVRRAPAPVITPWPTSATVVTLGDKLSESNLNIVSNALGTFAWDDPDIEPEVDNEGYDVKFTPSAATIANYVAFHADSLIKKVMVPVTEGPTFDVKVNNVSIGKHEEGDTVSINIAAGITPPGQTFAKWISDGDDVEFLDPTLAAAKFIMPAEDVSVTAIFDAAKPVITDPQDRSVKLNVAVTLTTTAVEPDSGKLTYQWYRNTALNMTGWTKIEGATDSTYVPATDSLRTLYYYVEVTNTNNNANGQKVVIATSRFVTIAVVEGDLVDAEFPVISGPANITVKVGTDSTVLAITASSPDSGTLSYQWYSNTAENTTGGTLIAGETDSTYTVNTDSLGTFYFYVEVTNTNNKVDGDTTAKSTSRLVTVTIVTEVSVVDIARVIPKDDELTAIITPVNALTGRFTAGPNPVSRQAGTVNFYRQGKRVNNAVMTIYDASGNLINRVRISDAGISGNSATRTVGSWNLKDTKGREVSGGTYLVRGVVTDVNGNRERVSMAISVR